MCAEAHVEWRLALSQKEDPGRVTGNRLQDSLSNLALDLDPYATVLFEPHRRSWDDVLFAPPRPPAANHPIFCRNSIVIAPKIAFGIDYIIRDQAEILAEK